AQAQAQDCWLPFKAWACIAIAASSANQTLISLFFFSHKTAKSVIHFHRLKVFDILWRILGFNLLRNLSDLIPKDVLVDILIRLLSESRLRFQCVCKDWLSLDPTSKIPQNWVWSGSL
ncbi:hypothetical protein FRX31_005156, partial [Thalictrum thalictroides]